MEITYHWEGDYLIPDLALSDTTEYHIGKCGRSSPIALKMPMEYFEKSKSGIDRKEEKAYY